MYYIAKHLSWNGLLHYKYITEFPGDRIFLNRQKFGEVTGKMVYCDLCPICYTLLTSKMQNSPDK